MYVLCICFFSSRRRHTRCALVTGVQTCALPISTLSAHPPRPADLARPGKAATEKKATPEPEVRATIMRGDQQFPAAATPPKTELRAGDVSLNYPGVSIHEVARAILGDVLKLRYTQIGRAHV